MAECGRQERSSVLHLAIHMPYDISELALSPAQLPLMRVPLASPRVPRFPRVPRVPRYPWPLLEYPESPEYPETPGLS